MCRWRPIASRDFSLFLFLSILPHCISTTACISRNQFKQITRLRPNIAMSTAVSVYLIGAQCTGKTTLLAALIETIKLKYPSSPFSTVTEVTEMFCANTTLREKISQAIPTEHYNCNSLSSPLSLRKRPSSHTVLFYQTGQGLILLSTRCSMALLALSGSSKSHSSCHFCVIE
jgi:hypothetical protein